MRFINPFRNATLLAGAAIVVSSMLPLPAQAAISLDNFTVIAGGWQLERRCGHLDPDQHDNLGEVVAHAEVDAARHHGAAKVKEVLQGAKQFGEEMGADCGDETHDAVNSAYGVALQYVAARTAETNRTSEPKTQEAVTHHYADAGNLGTSPFGPGPVRLADRSLLPAAPLQAPALQAGPGLLEADQEASLRSDQAVWRRSRRPGIAPRQASGLQRFGLLRFQDPQHGLRRTAHNPERQIRSLLTVPRV